MPPSCSNLKTEFAYVSIPLGLDGVKMKDFAT
jgi:hypothetical protein